MSCGSLRLKWRAVLAIFVLVLAMTRAEIENEIEDDVNGRIFLNNQNSTLIPLGSGGAMLVSVVGIIAIVIGSVFLISMVFNPNGLKQGGGGGIFSPWLNPVGYPGAYQQQNQYYAQQQPQAHTYIYEPYSKLGYQTAAPVAR